MIPIAVIASIRIARQSATRTAAKGMYSVDAPSVAEPMAKTVVPMAISSAGLWPTRRSTQPSSGVDHARRAQHRDRAADDQQEEDDRLRVRHGARHHGEEHPRRQVDPRSATS
jgi:hypothetical protein